MSIDLNLVGIAVGGSAIAVFFWLMKALGAWLVSQGGLGDSLGRAILNVYP